MLSDRLETFTIELLSTFFNPLPFVVTSLLYWAYTMLSWVIGSACANSRYQAHRQCGLESKLDHWLITLAVTISTQVAGHQLHLTPRPQELQPQCNYQIWPGPVISASVLNQDNKYSSILCIYSWSDPVPGTMEKGHWSRKLELWLVCCLKRLLCWLAPDSRSHTSLLWF